MLVLVAALKSAEVRGQNTQFNEGDIGLIENLAEFYPEARWQRCVVHFYRNVWTAVPSSKMREVTAMLKAIHAQETRASGVSVSFFFPAFVACFTSADEFHSVK